MSGSGFGCAGGTAKWLFTLSVTHGCGLLMTSVHHPLARKHYENPSLRIVILGGGEIFDCALKISGEEELFQGIAHEIRNFSKKNCFTISFCKS